MKKLICLLFLFPLFVFSQAPKKYSSLLWKITGKGLKKPSYLYGTMHVSNRAAYYLSEEFFDALKSVDMVGLETNPGDWMENMEKTGELSELNMFNSANYYTRNFYAGTFANYAPTTKMLQGLLSYDPDIINGLLYRKNKTRENFEENTYIDLFIYQSASKLGKKVISLEDFAQSEIYARLSAMPDEEDQKNQMNYRDYNTISTKIEDAYREGDLSKLDSLSALTSSKNMVKYLINARNVIFANTIDSVLRTGSLFSGVGAAHLPGDMGVIELLRKAGYTVEPVKPNFTKKSIQQRENLDSEFKPVNFQNFTTSDSAFSLSMPGKLYHIASIDNLKYYLFADMVNGSFYSVARLKYLGPLYQTSADEMKYKIESLLFENIPGKIISKKDIVSNTGMKGLEIINKTRTGDEQHYQIYFSDLEIFLFKVGGKSSYASSNDVKKFFNSISFSSKSNTWLTFSPKTKGFRAKVPAEYSYDKLRGGSLIGLVEDLVAYDKETKTLVGVKHAVYNDFNYLEEDTFELNQLAKSILKGYEYNLEADYKLGTEQKLPSIQFTGKNKKGKQLYGKIIIKGVHYYFVYQIAGGSEDFNSMFFKSFMLEQFEYIHPIKEITDRGFYFRAKDEVTDDAASRFNEALAKAFAEAKVQETTRANDFDARIDNKYYYSPSSSECINISIDKYNDYDFREKKEMEERIVKRYKTTTTCTIKKTFSSDENGTYKMGFILKDTATARALDARIFIKDGILLEICAPFDTTVGNQGWTKSFMETFQIMDTVIGKDVFRNKFNDLTTDLCGSDTLKRRMANTSLLNSITLQKSNIDEFVKFITDKRLADVNEEGKAQLFVNGGLLESEKIIEPYKALYKQYTDSFYLQLCLLRGLTYLKTQKSFDAFYHLLMEETPLVGSEAIVNDVFSTLHDSIELCKRFFPSMVNLSKYDEYRYAVYALMAALVDKGILKASEYASMKDAIVIDANLALKRFNPSQIELYGSGDGKNSLASLDKPSKDLAEQIQYNLEGISNNNRFKGTKYLRILDASKRHNLVNFSILLSPFYKEDPKAKSFFSNISKIKQQAIALPVHVNLLQYNIVLNDTLSGHYCKNKFTRTYYYSELEKADLTAKFDKNYGTQQRLIESVIASQRQLNKFYRYDKEKLVKDSLGLLKRIEVSNKYQHGYLYVYQNSVTAKEDINWSVVFVNEAKRVTTNIQVLSIEQPLDLEKSIQENENDLLDYFYTGSRKRAQFNDGNYD